MRFPANGYDKCGWYGELHLKGEARQPVIASEIGVAGIDAVLRATLLLYVSGAVADSNVRNQIRVD